MKKTVVIARTKGTKQSRSFLDRHGRVRPRNDGRFCIKILLLFCVLGVYLLTLPKGIGLGDSGTLAAAAVNWGIPHPPGFPTYILLSHWFTYIPWGTMAQKLALVSVLASVATVGLIMEMAGVIPALILAFSYGFWSQAVNVETYALTNLVIVTVSYLSSRAAPVIPTRFAGASARRAERTREWRDLLGSKDPSTSLRSARDDNRVGMTGGDRIRSGVLLMTGIILGIGLGLNPIVVGVVPSLIFKIRRIRLIGLISLIALPIAVGLYSYLPLRAAMHPFLNWGDPATPSRFFKHITGGGLSIVSSTMVNGFTGSFYWLANSFGRFFYVFFVETLGLGMILVVIGGYFMFRNDRNKFWYWIILLLTNVILAGIYVSGNRDSWYITGMIGGMMMLNLSSRAERSEVEGSLEPRRSLHSRTRSVGMTTGGIGVIVAMLVVWGPRMWERARSNFVEAYISDLYRDLPENAILIGGGETFNSLTLYAHEALKLRPDVTPVDMTIFYGQEWYRKNLLLSSRAAPVISTEAKRSGEIFFGTNKDPSTSLRSARDDNRVGMTDVDMPKFTDEMEFTRVLEKFVTDNPSKTFFVTGYLLTTPIYANSNKPAYVPEKYQLEQHGIVYRLTSPLTKGRKEEGSDLNTPLDSPFERGKGGEKNPFYLESNYLKAVENIRLDYGLALEMRGDFFGANRVAPLYFDQNKLNTKIRELNTVK